MAIADRNKSHPRNAQLLNILSITYPVGRGNGMGSLIIDFYFSKEYVMLSNDELTQKVFRQIRMLS